MGSKTAGGAVEVSSRGLMRRRVTGRCGPPTLFADAAMEPWSEVLFNEF